MTSTTTRPELTGVGGVPETTLTEALIARLPINQSEAPWECTCTGLLWLGRGGKGATAALPEALRGRRGLGVAGGFVRYTDTPVGVYDEVLGIVATRQGLRPRGTVSFMSVDSESSLVGGRTNWAMPKSLATFAGDIGSKQTMTGTSADGIAWSVSATPRVLGPAIKLSSKGMTDQQFPGGEVGSSLLEFKGRVRPAIVTVTVESEGPLPQWMRSGRHLGLVVESAIFTLGEPQRG